MRPEQPRKKPTRQVTEQTKLDKWLIQRSEIRKPVWFQFKEAVGIHSLSTSAQIVIVDRYNLCLKFQGSNETWWVSKENVIALKAHVDEAQIK